MTIEFEELDFQQTPLGDISLRRRSEPMVGGQIVYEVKLGDEFLMSSLFTAAEIAFFPEGEPIVAPLCTAFEISFGVLCATYGQQWIDDNKGAAAKWMCEKAALCN